jgi:5-methylcytosine-specific restriction endonuclease McrA
MRHHRNAEGSVSLDDARTSVAGLSTLYILQARHTGHVLDFDNLVVEDVEDADWPHARRPTRPRPTALRCPNCNQQFSCRSFQRIYCSLRCHDEAKAVRYGRRKHKQYCNDLPDDIAYALQTKIQHALAGGYDAWARHIPPSTRRMIWARDSNDCQNCGRPAREIDHINGSSNDPSNLRLLCQDCHHQITAAHLRPITDPAMNARRVWLLVRISSATPLRVCDADDWAQRWREWVHEHAEFS